MSSVCILIPAYNAEKTVLPVVTECCEQGFPVVVVDDGSTDATGLVLEGLPITMLRHARNMGKGAALRSGFEWALTQGFKAVVTLDADGQHDPASVGRLVNS